MALSPAERQKRYRERTKAKVEPSRKRSRRKRYGESELLELLESLPQVRVGRNGYGEQDRAADFIAVFAGSDRGRRVLSQIAVMCDPPPTLADADKPGTLAFKTGMRRVMAEIQRCFVVMDPISVERTPNEDGATDGNR